MPVLMACEEACRGWKAACIGPHARRAEGGSDVHRLRVLCRVGSHTWRLSSPEVLSPRRQTHRCTGTQNAAAMRLLHGSTGRTGQRRWRERRCAGAIVKICGSVIFLLASVVGVLVAAAEGL
jgi:hypothetical protein